MLLYNYTSYELNQDSGYHPHQGSMPMELIRQHVHECENMSSPTQKMTSIHIHNC